MLFRRNGPACDLLGDDLAADWLWASEFRNGCDVEPTIGGGGNSGAKKAKRGAADGREDRGERQKLEK